MAIRSDSLDKMNSPILWPALPGGSLLQSGQKCRIHKPITRIFLVMVESLLFIHLFFGSIDELTGAENDSLRASSDQIL